MGYILEGRKEGIEEGRKEGLEEGGLRKMRELIAKKKARGKTLEQIADELEEDIGTIERMMKEL